MSDLGKAVRRKRLSQGLTLRALEKKVGVSFASLGRLERRQGQPSEATKDRLLRWLEDGSESLPAQRNSRLSRMAEIEIRVLHLEGIVTGMLDRLERG
jgi:transcriptional regulator with XRE-family HTH domain